MAGSKSDAFETSLLEHIFQNEDIANVGDATGIRGSSVAGSLYIALFTAVPTDSTPGTEANYTGYQRVAVARTAGGWTVSGDTVTNTAVVEFPPCTGGSNTITGFAIMTAATSGTILYWGDLTANLAVSPGINQIPQFAIGALQVTED